MAILKHIAVKNSNYGQMQRYLLFQHDSHTQKPILDENGDMMLREGYLMDALNCDRRRGFQIFNLKIRGFGFAETELGKSKI